MIGRRICRSAFATCAVSSAQYKGDVKLALLVYNRGPVAVESIRALGLDPTNGYEAAVTRGYNGKGRRC